MSNLIMFLSFGHGVFGLLSLRLRSGTVRAIEQSDQLAHQAALCPYKKIRLHFG